MTDTPTLSPETEANFRKRVVTKPGQPIPVPWELAAALINTIDAERAKSKAVIGGGIAFSELLNDERRLKLSISQDRDDLLEALEEAQEKAESDRRRIEALEKELDEALGYIDALSAGGIVEIMTEMRQAYPRMVKVRWSRL